VMIDDGLFDGLDAVLLFHPSNADYVECRLLACEDVDVTFTGRQAHAASDPWAGVNALDAMVMLLNGIALWRQQLRPDARVHGIVLEGGTAANIIPARTVGRFMIRSADEAAFGEMRRRFGALVDAAAQATGCTAEASFTGGSSTMLHNHVLGDRFGANLAAFGVADGPPDPAPGSSDMGNVSQILPTIHPHLAICAAGVAGHSPEFRDAARSAWADETTLLAAIVIAQTAIDLAADPALIDAAWIEFRQSQPAGTG
jgi:metal-dependent amidase/aminoacylase/carboxypeptidase family protein